jgi:NTE family protein
MMEDLMSINHALVLSGGSIKGAFQAGAIKILLEKGFKPEFISGISVGSLNGAFLCSEAGRQKQLSAAVDWPSVGKRLCDFWTANATKPADLVDKRPIPAIAWHAFFNTFDGLVDTAPLKKLINTNLSVANIRASGIDLRVGALNIVSGKLTYFDDSDAMFLERVLASAAIPIIMPAVKFGDERFVDGGVKEIAPLKPAIKSGANRIAIIACQASRSVELPINVGNLVHMIERTIDLMTDEIVNNDIEWAQYIDELVPESGADPNSPLAGYRKLKPIVIRPDEPLPFDIRSFTASDIAAIMAAGEEAAKKALNDNPI